MVACTPGEVNGSSVRGELRRNLKLYSAAKHCVLNTGHQDHVSSHIHNPTGFLKYKYVATKCLNINPKTIHQKPIK